MNAALTEWLVDPKSDEDDGSMRVHAHVVTGVEAPRRGYIKAGTEEKIEMHVAVAGGSSTS